MLTLEQVKSLKHGQVLYHVVKRNADGTPQRWRVSGAVKTWKKDPKRVRVPLKFGLYGPSSELYQDQTVQFMASMARKFSHHNNFAFYALTEQEAIEALEKA